MERVSIKDIECAVDHLNELAGTPKTPWTRGADGKHRANIGNYHISQAYGGVAIHQMQNLGGGIRQLFGYGHMPKRDCLNQLHAFLLGFEAAKGLR